MNTGNIYRIPKYNSNYPACYRFLPAEENWDSLTGWVKIEEGEICTCISPKTFLHVPTVEYGFRASFTLTELFKPEKLEILYDSVSGSFYRDRSISGYIMCNLNLKKFFIGEMDFKLLKKIS